MMGANYSDGGEYDQNNMGDLQELNDYGDNRENTGLWLKKPEVVNHIRKKFSHFLRSFADNGEHTYEARITEMCQNNKRSIEVNFVHISNRLPQIAIWLAEEPAEMIPILNDGRQWREVVTLLGHMKEEGIPLTNKSYPAVIAACCRIEANWARAEKM